MEWVQPRNLADLAAVFERLSRGAVVALGEPTELAGPAAPPAADGTAWLGMRSSGSTGRPKLVWQRWPELLREVGEPARMRPWTWASPYQPESYAGVQAALHAWVGKGRIGTVTNDWPATWETLRTQAVDALSCTPTFLDLLLQHEPAAPHAWVPRQVTLGGEVLRPHAGARFAARFPATGFTVVYAAAELGVLLRTRRLDGLYELGSLVKRYPCWRLVEGVLEVRRGGQWRSTGDRLKVNGAEVRIVGRADAVANVAGTKVSLAEVAERAEQVPGVRRAVALAEASPVTGQIVCLRWAIEPGSDVRAVTQALEAHLQRHLRKEAWPRRWEREEVGPAANAKRASA